MPKKEKSERVKKVRKESAKPERLCRRCQKAFTAESVCEHCGAEN